MARQCLFCNNKAGSREHLWPAWSHERLRITTPIRIAFGNKPVNISNNPEIKVKTVCRTCNNGWMSSLEASCIPLIGSLRQDISTPLDPLQQALLSAWALKTAMITDSTNKTGRSFFYENSECEGVRANYTIPDRTRVWIGRVSKKSLAAIGKDVWIDMPSATKVAKATAIAIVIGHLVFEVFTIHIPPQHIGSESQITSVQPKPGRWNEALLPIWPIGSRPISWPPALSFDTTNSGQYPISLFLNRWKMGKNATV